MIGVVVATLALGGGICHQSVVQQQYVSPVVASPVYYFVGAPIRAQAVMQQDADYQEFQQFKAWKQQQLQNQTAPSAPANPQPFAAPTTGAIQKHCADCHSVPNADNNFMKLTGEEELDPITASRALRSISYSKEQAEALGFSAMPKGKTLTKEERNAIAHQIFSLTKGLD